MISAVILPPLQPSSANWENNPNSCWLSAVGSADMLGNLKIMLDLITKSQCSAHFPCWGRFKFNVHFVLDGCTMLYPLVHCLGIASCWKTAMRVASKPLSLWRILRNLREKCWMLEPPSFLQGISTSFRASNPDEGIVLEKWIHKTSHFKSH